MADVGKGLALLLGSVLGSFVSPAPVLVMPSQVQVLPHRDVPVRRPAQLAMLYDSSHWMDWCIKAAKGMLTAPAAACPQSCVGHSFVRASLATLG